MQVQLLVHTSRKARCGFASKTLSLNCALAHFFNDTFFIHYTQNAFSRSNSAEEMYNYNLFKDNDFLSQNQRQ